MRVSMKCQASILRKWLQINSKKCLNWNKMWAILSHMIWKLWIVKLYHTRIPCVVSRYQIIVIFIILNTYMRSVQFSSVTHCVWLCDAMDYSSLGLPVQHQLPEFTQTHLHLVIMSSNHLILCYFLLLLPSIFPSIRVFSNESALHIRWPKYCSFSFNISTSNEYSEMISFRMDLLDLLAVQGTLKSLFQHHSSKTAIRQCSAFFIVQLSHPYMTTGKTIALTRRTFVAK